MKFFLLASRTDALLQSEVVLLQSRCCFFLAQNKDLCPKHIYWYFENNLKFSCYCIILPVLVIIAVYEIPFRDTFDVHRGVLTFKWRSSLREICEMQMVVNFHRGLCYKYARWRSLIKSTVRQFWLFYNRLKLLEVN